MAQKTDLKSVGLSKSFAGSNPASRTKSQCMEIEGAGHCWLPVDEWDEYRKGDIATFVEDRCVTCHERRIRFKYSDPSPDLYNVIKRFIKKIRA